MKTRCYRITNIDWLFYSFAEVKNHFAMMSEKQKRGCKTTFIIGYHYADQPTVHYQYLYKNGKDHFKRL